MYRLKAAQEALLTSKSSTRKKKESMIGSNLRSEINKGERLMKRGIRVLLYQEVAQSGDL